MSEDKRAQPDWERIEILYRAGTLSVREIAASAGVSHTAINKRAKKEDWPRDLNAKIKARADALVSKATVSKEVSAEALATEKVVVEVEAQVRARLTMSHRTDVPRVRALAMKMLGELESQTEDLPFYEDLGEMLRSPDAAGMDKLNDLYRRVVALPTRAKVVKDLADTLRVLIALEREAFGLDADPEIEGAAGKTISDAERASRLATIMARARKAADGAGS